MKREFGGGTPVFVLLVLALAFTAQCTAPETLPLATPTVTEPPRFIQPTFTSTPSPTMTATPTSTPLPTATPDATATPVPTATPSPTPTLSPTPTRIEPYYGIHYVPMEDLAKAKELGAEVVLRDMPDHGTPEQWLAILDEFEANDLKLLAWFWEPGWRWDKVAERWIITDQARLFLETVADHPALFAVYMLHEPYWNNCRGCGYTTAQQQQLYRMLKEIADVPLYSTPGAISLWDERGAETMFDVEVCDYCAVWKYPFKVGTEGIIDKQKMIDVLQKEIDLVRERSPDSKIVWILQGFAQGEPFNLRMPKPEEMRELAEIVYDMEIAGAAWYPWSFGKLYSDTLSLNPELHDTIREIYDEVVLPSRK